jgi:hypothetical protein
MKAISVGIDLGSNKLAKLPPIYEFAGYILCPANLVLGPFSSFSNYKQPSKGFKFPLKLFTQIAINSILSIVFILLSTCFLNYLIPDTAR